MWKKDGFLRPISLYFSENRELQQAMELAYLYFTMKKKKGKDCSLPLPRQNS